MRFIIFTIALTLFLSCSSGDKNTADNDLPLASDDSMLTTDESLLPDDSSLPTDTDLQLTDDSSPLTDEDSSISNDSDIVIINSSAHNTILGRPTDTSIAVSILADAAGDKAYIEYSTELDPENKALSGSVSSTDPVTSSAGEPIVIDIKGLKADTKYFYRAQYNSAPDTIHSFHTQRAKGGTFTFGVQGDTHPERYNNKMYSSDLMTLTMNAVRDHQPDFYFMIGDDFSIEKIIQNFKKVNFAADYAFTRAVEGSMSYADYQTNIKKPFDRAMIVDAVGAPQGNAGYLAYRKDFLGIMANATALYLVNGNHEQAHSANLGGIFNNAAIWAADARLKYYPLPAPDGFYTGDNKVMASVNGYPTIEAKDGLLRDYYAFTWGDALFVTIDPYWHSDLQSPDGMLFNGDKEDPWAATMGDEQYKWLKETLEESTAKWKFVFAHHVNGNGRGGAESSGVQEWGGNTSDFKAHRPNWDKPVHQILADNGVTIFFQGHDHIFAREIIDGVVYQSLPNPADNSYFAYNCTAYDLTGITWQGPAGYGQYDPSYTVIMPNTGYINVTVSPDKVGVEYIRTYRDIDLQTDPNNIFSGKETNGEVAFKYSVPAQPDDDQAADFHYTCIGDTTPGGWVYNP